MNQARPHRVPDVSSGYHTHGQVIARIHDAYGRLPRLFAVPDDARAGFVTAWGVELPDGSAVTYRPGGAFGTWETPVNAAALLGDGAEPVYLGAPGM